MLAQAENFTNLTEK